MNSLSSLYGLDPDTSAQAISHCGVHCRCYARLLCSASVDCSRVLRITWMLFSPSTLRFATSEFVAHSSPFTPRKARPLDWTLHDHEFSTYFHSSSRIGPFQLHRCCHAEPELLLLAPLRLQILATACAYHRLPLDLQANARSFPAKPLSS